jgi:hypothetical protein
MLFLYLHKIFYNHLSVTMNTFKSFLVSVLFISVNGIFAQSEKDSSSVLWSLDNFENVRGYKITPLQTFPSTIKTPQGSALSFDGIDQAVLLDTNPLEDAEEFTIEAVIKPDSSTNPINKEQRFIHIRETDAKRILLETRLFPNQTWVLDSFVGSDISHCTLIDSAKTHAVDKWYHVALIYKNGVMKHFINGEKELEDKIDFQPLKKGTISIGARQNPKSWFKGAIAKIRFTKRALEPKDFMNFNAE